jgi:hypothetical protein
MNEIQYVYDAGGHKKSVIVPVELWERTLQVQKARLAPCNPQEYYGIYRDRIKNPDDIARALRSEWNRGNHCAFFTGPVLLTKPDDLFRL